MTPTIINILDADWGYVDVTIDEIPVHTKVTTGNPLARITVSVFDVIAACFAIPATPAEQRPLIGARLRGVLAQKPAVVECPIVLIDADFAVDDAESLYWSVVDSTVGAGSVFGPTDALGTFYKAITSAAILDTIRGLIHSGGSIGFGVNTGDAEDVGVELQRGDGLQLILDFADLTAKPRPSAMRPSAMRPSGLRPDWSASSP